MKRLSLWIPPILWMCIIFYFSSKQKVSVSSEYVLNFLFFKSLHVIEYGILYLLNYRALLGTLGNKAIHNSFFIAFVLTIFYAASDEFHQTLVPTREGALRDVIIDGLGATLLWIFLVYLLPKAPKALRNLAKTLQVI